MDNLLKNLESMGNNQTDDFKRLVLDAQPTTERECLNNGSDIPYYRHNKDGRWLSLASAYTPFEEAKRMCDHLLPSTDLDASICFVLGEAGLFHVEEILQRVSKKTLVIVVSHRPDYLKLVLETRDVSHFVGDPRLLFAVTDDEEKLKQFVSDVITMHPRKIPTFTVFEHSVESKIQTEFFHTIQQQIAWVYRTLMVNFNTSARYEGFWAENFMMNIPYFLGAKVADGLKSSWEDKPVIIVGAGPSLQKNIDVLKETQGKALIMCVDTAYRIIDKHGIQPDLVVTIDGTPMNSKHLEDCDYSQAPLMADYYARYDILQNHKNHKVFLDTIEFHSDWWKRVAPQAQNVSTLASGGSVATLAFSFAKLIGANPIILTGIDLSYPGGKYYADGAVNSDKTIEDIKKTRKVIELTDIHGDPVYTTEDYHYYLKWFEREALSGGHIYINASEGGALKEGFDLRTLQETAQQYCSAELDIDQWKSLMEPDLISEEQTLSIARNIKRSYFESKALVKYSDLLIKRLYRFVALVRDEKDNELVDVARFIEKGHQKLMGLKLALSFINGQSVKIAWRDSLVETVLEEGRETLTQREVTIASANRTLDLYVNFHQLAKESVELHRRGLAQFKEFYDVKEPS